VVAESAPVPNGSLTAHAPPEKKKKKQKEKKNDAVKDLVTQLEFITQQRFTVQELTPVAKFITQVSEGVVSCRLEVRAPNVLTWCVVSLHRTASPRFPIW